MAKKVIIGTGLLLLFLPLLPAASFRGILSVLLEFPIRTHHVAHPPFSLPVFLLFSCTALVLGAVLLFPRLFSFKRMPASEPGRPIRPLPSWGYAGIILTAASWICAWGRLDFFRVVNDFTFFPLWLGYILTVDAWVFKRSGSSILHRSPRTFIALFPASAVAWWYFEYLNRFVQNWWYAGVEDYSALKYALLSTISFSTVFPAVFETRELLGTTARFREAYRTGPRWFTPSRSACRFMLVSGASLLFLTGIYPAELFFLTWFAPLVILGATLSLAGIETPLTSMRRGDYTDFFTLAAAALICGFFWEMWNVHSMPRWYYSIPYVMKGKLFEMPLPGYGGYLPFGPICWMMWLSMKNLLSAPHSGKR